MLLKGDHTPIRSSTMASITSGQIHITPNKKLGKNGTTNIAPKQRTRAAIFIFLGMLILMPRSKRRLKTFEVTSRLYHSNAMGRSPEDPRTAYIVNSFMGMRLPFG